MQHVDERIDRIKRRIRGLLNLAADDAAAEGEIANAMAAAERLMQEHQLEAADFEAATAQEVRAETRHGVVETTTQGKALSTWESTLAFAVSNLVGTTGWYRNRDKRTVGVGTFKQPSIRSVVFFYGPQEDAEIARELFDEWSHTIATMATGRYGGCFHGDGAKYAYGFASALYYRTQKIERERAQITTESTAALVRVSGGSLAQVLDQKKQAAKDWVQKEIGLNFRKGSAGAGYRSGSHDAYSSGLADGSKAEFSATRRRKLTG